MPDDSHEDIAARLAAEPTPRMPDDVATRLHDALAAEAQDREGSQSAEPAASTVIPLRRRGRWKGPLLVAAGIVAVVAIGIPVINQTSTDQASDDGGSDDGVMSSDSSGSSSGSTGNSDEAAPRTEQEAPLAPLALHRATFKADADAYRDVLESDDSLAPTQMRVAAVGCEAGRPSAPGALPAKLDGDDAVVLTTRQSSGGVRVKAVVCGPDGPTVAARTTLD